MKRMIRRFERTARGARLYFEIEYPPQVVRMALRSDGSAEGIPAYDYRAVLTESGVVVDGQDSPAENKTLEFGNRVKAAIVAAAIVAQKTQDGFREVAKQPPAFRPRTSGYCSDCGGWHNDLTRGCAIFAPSRDTTAAAPVPAPAPVLAPAPAPTSRYSDTTCCGRRVPIGASACPVCDEPVRQANPRRLWSGSVRTRWRPRPGLFTEDAETIAKEVLEGHGWKLAPSAAAINFYVNRAGRNLSARDHARLRHALAIVEREGVSKRSDYR